ncbi:glycosyltransferase [Candidatus Bathyarchaeota archaeon]|nr:glycosyltransferase [Candidatus Bathyarchaeota archaeon]
MLRYLPTSIEKEHIKRSRGLWSKTFSIAYRIFRINADVYHAHYLLQDCYIASRLGKKPLVGHAHGTDLRRSLKHPLWGRIVRHNLKSCSKILVSTADVLSTARRLRNDAEYLPNPVDTKLFYPKPIAQSSEKKKVLIASDCNWAVKGTDVAIRALNVIKDEVDVSIISYGVDFQKTLTLALSLGLRLNVLSKAPHEKLAEYYWDSDLVIDRFTLGSLGMVSLEAIACGRPVLAYVSSEYPENRDFPLKDVKDQESIVEAIRDLAPQLWQDEYAFFKRHHAIETIESRLLSIYDSLLSG